MKIKLVVKKEGESGKGLNNGGKTVDKKGIRTKDYYLVVDKIDRIKKRKGRIVNNVRKTEDKVKKR